ncbi:hypothetical protein A6R68_11341, partial [Neotoma lepida]
EVQKHSVHTLVFRSLKRTHDMFVADNGKPVPLDEERQVLFLSVSKVFKILILIEEHREKSFIDLKFHKRKMAIKLRNEYGPVLHMPTSKENLKEKGPQNAADSYPHKQYPANQGVALTADTKIQRMPSESAAQSLAVALPNQARYAYYALMIMEAGNTKNSALMAKKAPTMPKPQWHPPWKLYRMCIRDRCIAVEPGNQWFVTGSADRTIKVIRKMLVYGLDLHPTIDVLVTCSRDSTARIWDVRTKASVHTLSGHTNAVATVRCQAAEPQIITDNIKQWKFPDGGFIQNLSGHNAIINTLAVNADGVLVSGADNGTMHLWDWRTGYNFQRVHAAVQPGSLDSESGIFACAFDQSESRLLTAEADKTIKVYREDETA